MLFLLLGRRPVLGLKARAFLAHGEARRSRGSACDESRSPERTRLEFSLGVSIPWRSISARLHKYRLPEIRFTRPTKRALSGLRTALLPFPRLRCAAPWARKARAFSPEKTLRVQATTSTSGECRRRLFQQLPMGRGGAEARGTVGRLGERTCVRGRSVSGTSGQCQRAWHRRSARRANLRKRPFG